MTPDPDRADIERLLAAAPAPGFGTIAGIDDVNRGRGVFSRVLRVALSASGPGGITSVVVKLPAPGANGEAGRRSGAYRREVEAYRCLLPTSPVRTPRLHLVTTDDDGGASFVLEDLTPLRAVDQLDGLGPDDALGVVLALRRLHDHWRPASAAALDTVRRATPSSLAPAALEAGLAALDDRWGDHVDAGTRAAFRRLVGRLDELVAAFAAAGPPTLCHGDPRADNLVFDLGDEPVLFDWQQIAVQLGEADLAWLASTSLTPDRRRAVEGELVAAYGTTTDRFRLGLVLPALAVLLLAQRDTVDERSLRFVVASLQRIGAAIADLDVASVGP